MRRGTVASVSVVRGICAAAILAASVVGCADEAGIGLRQPTAAAALWPHLDAAPVMSPDAHSDGLSSPLEDLSPAPDAPSPADAFTAPDVAPAADTLADAGDTTPPLDALPDAPLDAVADALPDALADAPGGTDTGPAPDLAEPDTTEPPPADTGPSPHELVVRHSGDDTGTCRFDYKLPLLSTCPSPCGRTVRVDASGSVGVQTLDWRFSVDRDYVVTPGTASGLVAEFAITVPACGLIGDPVLRSAEVALEASVNGGPFEVVSSLTIDPRLVVNCPGASDSGCTHP